MKFYFSFLCFLFLLSCSSTQKNSYDSVLKEQNDFFGKTNDVSRGVAYLKNISQFDEGNFQFVIKQMKVVIKNYNNMKEKLSTIESKIDKLISQKSLLGEAQENQNLEQETDLSEEDSKTLLEENSVSSQEEVTDDMSIFNEEGTKSGSQLQNSVPVLEKNSKTGANIQDKNWKIYFEKAKKLYKNKSYESAISKFQKYRQENPEGRDYPEATFYIGQSFKNLKMSIESKVFFKEVVKSYPQSLWASRAKKILEE